MAPTDPNRIAADLAAVQDAFARINPGDDAQGMSADALREALAGHSDHLDDITSAVQSVAAAVEQRKALIAERDATMPTEQEIDAAERRLVIAAALAADAAAAGDSAATAAANAEVRQATEHLADLLAQKKAAQERFDQGERDTAETLDTDTADLGGADAPPGVAAAAGPLGAMLSAMQRMQAASPPPLTAAGLPPQMPDDVLTSSAIVPDDAGDYGPTATLSHQAQDPGIALLNALLDGMDDNTTSTSHHNPSAAGDVPQEEEALDLDPVFGAGQDWSETGMGQTHTSADIPVQMPSLSGVATPADVSGRPANPFFAAAPPAPTTGAPMGGGMIPPMMPMGAGAMGTGVAPGRDKDGQTIIKADPDMTGADIDARIATSGVIGRDTKHR